MGYFDDCEPEDRFTTDGYGGYHEPGVVDGKAWKVIDFDQRRTISVATAWWEDDEDFILEAIAEHMDDLPPDTVLVEIGQEGEPLKCLSEPRHDGTVIPFYPSASEFASDVPRIRRSDLLELDRLGLQVDLATCKTDSGDSPRVAFKYSFIKNNVTAIWHEVNCLLRIPKHPNIVPLDCIVVDAVNGDDKLVGYTTPFVPGGVVGTNLDRVFKLKYLEQLLSVVDHLNHDLGIIHSDIGPHNLLINPETDSLQIFDFNLSAKLGWAGDPRESTPFNTYDSGTFSYDADRDDVKFTIFTVYEIITRDMHFREENNPPDLDVGMVTSIVTWEKHPDVRLDADAGEYRRLLEVWVEARGKVDPGLTHYTQARNHIDWPCLPEFPLVSVPWTNVPARLASRTRQDLVRSGEDFLNWQRVPSCELPLPEGRRLLATGEVVDEEGEVVV